MLRTIIVLTLFLSSVCFAVPVLEDVDNAPEIQSNTGVAGYGFNDSGWLSSVIMDVEFDKPSQVNQFFNQTYFKVEPKPSAKGKAKPVDSGLLNAVDDAFNNKQLLRVNPAEVSEPPLFLWVMFLGVMIMIVKNYGHLPVEGAWR